MVNLFFWWCTESILIVFVKVYINRYHPFTDFQSKSFLSVSNSSTQWQSEGTSWLKLGSVHTSALNCMLKLKDVVVWTWLCEKIVIIVVCKPDCIIDSNTVRSPCLLTKLPTWPKFCKKTGNTIIHGQKKRRSQG